MQYLPKNIVEYDNIYIVDALTTTVGIRVMIDKAIEMIKEGKEAQEIVTYLEEMRSHIKILAAVDTLEYLCKGGRVSKTTAAIGEMAKYQANRYSEFRWKSRCHWKTIRINKTISYIWSKWKNLRLIKTIRFTLCLHMVQKIVRNWKLALKRMVSKLLVDYK